MVALSSGESEFYAAVKSSAIGLGFVSLFADMGVSFESPCDVRIDASACLGIAARRGAGRIRHIATPTLWLQQAVHEKRINVCKVLGTANPADLGTKHVPKAVIDHAWLTMGFKSVTGESGLALRAGLAH